MLRNRLVRAYDDRARRRRDARGHHDSGLDTLPRLQRLGPAWHLLALPDGPETPDARTDHVARRIFAVGPGGLFLITVVEHGRARLLLAGDVVQVNSRRPAYVTGARKLARRVAARLSEAVTTTVPVTPVVAFSGSGVISVHGLPKDCLVATDREIDRLLAAPGSRIAPATAAKLAAVAVPLLATIDDDSPGPRHHDTPW